VVPVKAKGATRTSRRTSSSAAAAQLTPLSHPVTPQSPQLTSQSSHTMPLQQAVTPAKRQKLDHALGTSSGKGQRGQNPKGGQEGTERQSFVGQSPTDEQGGGNAADAQGPPENSRGEKEASGHVANVEVSSAAEAASDGLLAGELTRKLFDATHATR